MKPDKLTAIVIFDIDGVIRDVGNSYRRAIADTVEHFTSNAWRPTLDDIDLLKSEGIWNNDWKVSQELTYRYFESIGKLRSEIALDYPEIVNFFQGRYRGKNAECFDGYITQEPLLISVDYLQKLSDRAIGWGFFSGATRGSAEYVLKKRLGLEETVLVAMEDAPSKPDPTGLFAAIAQINFNSSCPVFYLGDTVADMYTVVRARQIRAQRDWIGIGILPPHVQSSSSKKTAYTETLVEAGATAVFDNVEEFNVKAMEQTLSHLKKN
ncbi:TIGR01548 family HAD-type hydrolase [Myxosarcina sp. GI1]|uniref:TIGR01548 family HAD-type hydrolase n=1 Tax=Myxosarcina sp. GI1 TaxID=1541065 RepID=UPI000559CC86|nr:TIGR01548 family HAD-type hydrolase [Myxosarcina sp. GI1]